MLQAQVVLGTFIPRQIHQGLEIVELGGVVWTLWVKRIEFLEFFLEGFLHILVPFLGLSLVENLFFLRTHIVAAQLFLDVLELLLQEVFTLLLVDVVLGLSSDVRLESVHLHQHVFHLQCFYDTVFHLIHAEQFHLVFYGERHGREDEVRPNQWVGYVVEGIFRLVWHILASMNQLDGLCSECLLQEGEFWVVLLWPTFGDAFYFTLVERYRLGNLVQLASTQSLGYDGSLSLLSRQVDHLNETAEDANLVEVFLRRIFFVGIFLGESTEDRFALLLLLKMF